MDRERLETALTALGRTLADRQLEYRVLIVGGSALLLMHEDARPTADVDVFAVSVRGPPVRVSSELPVELMEAARDVADVLGLAHDWFNGAAAAVITALPPGYEMRTSHRQYGALWVQSLGRVDQAHIKLLAAADEGPHGRHLADVLLMRLTQAELVAVLEGVRGQPIEQELADVLPILERAVHDSR